MLSSASLAALRRVLISSGAAAPWRQSTGLAARALVLRLATPSVRTISISASMRSPAAKSTTSKSKSKTSAKKSTTKKTAKPKAKKPVKKAVKKKVAAKKPKKAVKKKLTPEQKEKAEIKKLKEMSLLKGPTLLPETAWNVYLVDNIRGSSGSAIERAKALSTSFKNLTETEKERLASVGNSNKIANQETKKNWIQSFPPEAIYTANLARRRLARKTDKGKIYLIHDDRLPHRSGNAFTLYLKEQYSQIGAEKATDAMKTISGQWKSLSPSEKAPYVDRANELNKGVEGQAKTLREKGNQYWKEKLASPAA
ncbi:hypothetical protein CFAM422_000597 [Trichoderma lentiforme]|uniref:HMG box domain-containing protein n=1 Tax=Trichoderma lentiforme TaxID=1567552 RepID=A0A9P4XRY2_9HYPO|nr:hypothetical protein CFAM422_000597 [Trichoderma lentiforme]